MAKDAGWIATAKNMEIPAHVPRVSWQDFVDMRVLKHAPLTERACRIVFEKLAVYHAAGMDPKAVLDQSIEHGWLTVYQLKNPSTPLLPDDRPSLMKHSV